MHEIMDIVQYMCETFLAIKERGLGWFVVLLWNVGQKHLKMAVSVGQYIPHIISTGFTIKMKNGKTSKLILHILYFLQRLHYFLMSHKYVPVFYLT